MRWRSNAQVELFALELLLECGELGEGRIGIRLLVAAAAAAAAGPIGLGVILLALGAIGAVVALAARAVAARGLPIAIEPYPLARTLARAALVLALGALTLAVGALLAFVTVAAGLPVGLFVAARALLRFAGNVRCGRGGFGGRGGNRLAALSRWRGRRWRRRCRCRCRFLPARAARTMRPPLGTAGRAPDFDEGGFFGRRGGGDLDRPRPRRLRRRRSAGAASAGAVSAGAASTGGSPACGMNSASGNNATEDSAGAHFGRGRGRRLDFSGTARPAPPASLHFGHRLRRFGLAVHAIAERAQDRGEVLARRAGERRHGAGDREATAVDGAIRLCRLHAIAPGQRRADRGRPAAPGYRRARRARRRCGSRRCGRAASACLC